MRSKLSLTVGLIIIFALAWHPAPAGAEPGTKKVSLELLDLKTGAQLYKGTREETREGGRVTIKYSYMKLDGTEIQQVTAVHEEKSLRLISYKLLDLRSGKREEMNVKGGVVKMLSQKNKDEEVETDQLQWGEKTAYTGSLVEIVRGNWEKLNEEQPVEMDLLVPSRLETVGFRLLKDSEAELAGKPVVLVRMEPNSWLIRQIVDPLFFYFVKDSPHELLQYTGRSSIRTDKGKTQDLRTVIHPMPGG